MKQGMTKRLKPKDKHLSASWKKRDEGRKGKQDAYVQDAITRVDAEAREAATYPNPEEYITGDPS